MAQTKIAPVHGGAKRKSASRRADSAPRRREAALAEANALLRAALDNMHQGFLVTDADGAVVMWNDRFLALNGIEVRTIRTGMPGIELIRAAAEAGEYGTGDVEELTTQRFGQMRGGGDTRRRRNGMLIDCHANRMPSGHVIRTYTDITGAVEREREVEQQRAFLTGTLANIEQGILVLDADLRLRVWNERAVELLRIPPELRRPGVHLTDLITDFRHREGLPPEKVAAMVAARVKDFSRDHVITLPPHLFGGRVIERCRRGLPDGGVVLVYRDITEATQREHEIAEKSTLLTATLENMDQGLVMFDADMQVQIWNRHLADLLDLPRDIFRVGMTATEFVKTLSSGGGRTPEASEEKIARRVEEFRLGQFRTLTPSEGNGRVLERRSRPMPDGGMVVTYADVTEAKRHEDELAEKGALLAATLDNMDQGLIVVDGEYRAKLWNNRLT
ncbi:MAG: PAS-domain containing protein, partial [Stellaceae bacterium]